MFGLKKNIYKRKKVPCSDWAGLGDSAVGRKEVGVWVKQRPAVTGRQRSGKFHYSNTEPIVRQ